MTLSPEREAEIARLHHAEHWPVGTIARQLGVHEDVVRRVLGLERSRTTPGPREPKPRLVDPYLPFLIQTLERYPRLRATRLYDMIRDRGYTGSVRRLREIVADIRPTPKHEVFARLDLLVGEQSQIDWAHLGEIRVDGAVRALWVFVVVLAWSRAIWAELVVDLTVHSLLRSLVRASRFFGGVTRQWLFDNPKIVVLERDGDTARFHPLLLDLAGKYHVQLRLCAPRKANQKGRVERAIRFLRERHFAGRVVSRIDDGNRELLRFIEEIALQRQHPDLPSRSVRDCFNEEQTRLLPLPNVEPCTDLIRPVTVDKTGYVRFDRNHYAVPNFSEQAITLIADDREVRLAEGTEEILRYPRCWGARQRIGREQLNRAIAAQKPQVAESSARARMRAASPRFDDLVARWVDAGRNVGSMTAQAVRLLDLYGDEIFAAATGEIIERGTHDIGALAVLCERRRRAHHKPVPVELVLPEHVPDRDVIPPDLEVYDERRRLDGATSRARLPKPE